SPYFWAELDAQPADVNVHRPRLDFAGARVSPDAVQQKLAGQDTPSRVDEGPQQVELLGCEGQDSFPHGHRVSPRIYRQRSERGGSRAGSGPAAAQHGPYPGEKLLGREGLDHVVVGADLEPEHPIDLVT